MDNDIIPNIPNKAWNKLVETACETFKELIYPLTAFTHGSGRMIENKFNELTSIQQIFASASIKKAKQKIDDSDKEIDQVIIKPIIIYEMFKNIDNQSDPTIQELWANLLANEFTSGGVHPEIAILLGKITSNDAILLAKIAEKSTEHLSIKVLKGLASIYTLGIFGENTTFNHKYLERLGLIREIEKIWDLTVVGKEFIKCVSDIDTI